MVSSVSGEILFQSNRSLLVQYEVELYYSDIAGYLASFFGLTAILELEGKIAKYIFIFNESKLI